MFIEIHDSGKCLPFLVQNIGQSPRQSPIDRPKGHPFHHMIWVDKGSGTFEFGGKRYELEAGSGFFCLAGIPHAYHASDAEFATRWVTFSGGEGIMRYYGAPEWFAFHASSELIASTDELEKICSGNSTPLTRSVAGYRWFSEFMTGVFAPRSTEAYLLQYLETHFAENISLDDLASLVHTNRFTLCRYFQKTQGQTVMEKLKTIRLAKARELLRYTDCSVEEVASMCGYHSSSYFGKLFREENGVSPLQYKEMHIIKK